MSASIPCTGTSLSGLYYYGSEIYPSFPESSRHFHSTFATDVYQLIQKLKSESDSVFSLHLIAELEAIQIQWKTLKFTDQKLARDCIDRYTRFQQLAASGSGEPPTIDLFDDLEAGGYLIEFCHSEERLRSILSLHGRPFALMESDRSRHQKTAEPSQITYTLIFDDEKLTSCKIKASTIQKLGSCRKVVDYFVNIAFTRQIRAHARYKHTLDRNQATMLLQTSENENPEKQYSWLLRYSLRVNSFVLSLMHQGKIEHYKLTPSLDAETLIQGIVRNHISSPKHL